MSKSPDTSRFINERVEGAINRAAGKFGAGIGGALPKQESVDLARRFIQPPPIENMDQANEFARTIDRGVGAAREYFSPTYYHINNHLRQLGDSAPHEIAAIRRGDYGSPAAPHQIPGHPMYQPPEAIDLTDPKWLSSDAFDLGDEELDLAPLLGESKTIDEWDQLAPKTDVPKVGGSFSPNKDLLDAFQAKHGVDPYEAMGEWHGPIYDDAMAKHFGDLAPSYQKLFEDMAKRDGTWTGALPPNEFQLNPAKVQAFKEQAGIYGDVNPQALNALSPAQLESAIKAAGFGPETGQYMKFFGHDQPGFDAIQAEKAANLAGPNPAEVPAYMLPDVRSTIGGLMGLLDHSRLPETMDLYRGVDGSGLNKIESLLGAKLTSPDAIGKEFVDPGFMSTAFRKSTADQFAGLEPGYNRPDAGVTFTFPQVPQGKPASFMNASENEILFPPGRRVKITDNSQYPHLKADLYGTILAALMGSNVLSNQER